jgi:GNAT superfamily N-acetyltransferase
MTTTIRQAILQDVAMLQDLNHELFLSDSRHDPSLNNNWPYEKEGKKYFKDAVAGKVGEASTCLIAEADNQAIGYLSAFAKSPVTNTVRYAELDTLFVKETYRNQGVGGLLVEAFLQWAQKQQVDQVSVAAYALNTKALAFYKRHGFEPSVMRLVKTWD